LEAVGSEERNESDKARTNPGDARNTTKEMGQKFDDEQDLEFDEAASDEEDAEIPEGSLFDYAIPGVLTKDEVKHLDLDHWRLVVRNALIELEVRDLAEFVCTPVADRLAGPSRLGGLENRRPRLNQRHRRRAYRSHRAKAAPQQRVGAFLRQSQCHTNDLSGQTLTSKAWRNEY
jgi:hypothetical protein